MVTKGLKIGTSLTCLRYGKNMAIDEAVVKGIVVEDDVRKKLRSCSYKTCRPHKCFKLYFKYIEKSLEKFK